ncbi:MAG: HEAT repeat domain-containing protein [Dehalococcoidia bacterium]|nr:HEAT repeat domain-containing protein [Dehalococcoidia bacterium]
MSIRHTCEGSHALRASDEPRPGHALPGDEPRWPRDRTVDVRHIRLDLGIDVEARQVSGTATHTLRPLNDGLRVVEFDAIDLAIQSVTVDGKEAGFSYDGARLAVTLPDAAAGEECEVAVGYSARPRIGLYFIGPDAAYRDKPVQVWSQCQDEDGRYWFPAYDYPNQKQTSEMVVTVPGSWFALSNGRLVEECANADGTRTFHWLQERPHATYLMTLAAGEFTRIDASRPDLTVDYFVEAGDVEDGKRAFARTPEMIALFEQLTGVAYPWAKYSQIVVRDFVFGGMENTSATTMTRNILVDRKASRDFTSDGLVSHELAHMWWGDLLTCRDWSHGWLNESFATYFEMLWDEHHRGVDEYRQGVIDNARLYLEERYRRPVVTNVYHEPIDIFDRHLYEKGSLVLHMLRGLLGDEAFFRSIRRYCRDNQDRNVVTQDLIDAIAEETGRNLEWFFDQWLYRPGHPQLKVSWSWDETARLATVAVKQTQKTDDRTPVFRLPLTIDFTTGRGRPRAFRVEMTEKDQTFVFPLPARPDLCRFDPHNEVLKELDFDKSVGEWRLQLRDDNDIAGRQAAARGLGKKGGSEAIQALETAARDDRFWGVQAAAAKALGEVRTEAARDALIRLLAVRHPKARRGVVEALGSFHGDQAVLEALRPFAARDASWFVEAEANKSLGKLRLPAAFDVIAANFDRPSFRQVVRVGCLDGLVELRDEGAFPYFERAAAYGAWWQSRTTAVSAIARLTAFFPERKKHSGAALEQLLRDPDFRVRVAAANGLKTLGDADFAPALDDMAQRELDGRAVRAGRENALALRKGAETTDEVRRLRDDLEKLRNENVRLRDRLDRLEATRRPTA